MTMYFRKLSVTAALGLLGFLVTAPESSALPLIGGGGGYWDESVFCDYAGSNSVSPTTDPDDPDSAYTYHSSSTGTCTWTAPQKGKNKPDEVETATCSMEFNWPVTRGSCVATGVSGEYSVTYTGHCQADSLPVPIGTVNCSNGGTGGADPAFCDGTDCTWNHGFGIPGKGKTIRGMTSDECAAFDSLYGGQAFSYTEYFSDSNCTQLVRVDETKGNTGHSHSWSSDDPGYVATDRQGNVIFSDHNVATAEQGEIGPVSADTDPSSFDLTSGPTGTFQFRLNAVPIHPDTVAIDLSRIVWNSIKVNGVPVVPDSCSTNNSNPPSQLSCRVPRYYTNEDNQVVFTGTPLVDCTESTATGKCGEFTAKGDLTSGATFVSETVRAIISAQQ